MFEPRRRLQLCPDATKRIVDFAFGNHARVAIAEVSGDPLYRTNYGKIHYLQSLVRDHPLIMRPGNVYRLVVSFEPDVTVVDG